MTQTVANAFEFAVLYAAPLVLLSLYIAPNSWPHWHKNLRYVFHTLSHVKECFRRQDTVSSVTSSARRNCHKIRIVFHLALIYCVSWFPYWIRQFYEAGPVSWMHISSEGPSTEVAYSVMASSLARASPYAYVTCSWLFYNRLLRNAGQQRQESTETESVNLALTC